MQGLVPSAGNAAGALAAYAAASDIEAHIFMPRDVPLANYVEATAYGAKVTLVDGVISDCARIVSERKHPDCVYPRPMATTSSWTFFARRVAWPSLCPMQISLPR
ncbi:pyridoxal-phosphate dependent enzyme [Dyella sp. Tek66A03]|uniref:pyridoxal-phosphate dependent enzyme n=1 Tax=Dyella sp. Tek66A03 TaxID=3458298 RepID=UPI00403E663B